MNRAILIDVDSVLVDWHEGFYAHMVRRGHKLSHGGGPSDYSLETTFPDQTKENIGHEIDVFAHSDHYTLLHLYEGVKTEIWRIRNKFPSCVMLAVSCCGKSNTTVQGRKHQLRHLPLDGIIALGIKELKAPTYQQFFGAVVVDDSPIHLEAAMEAGHFAIAYDQPWNREFQPSGKNFKRVTSWAEVLA